MDDPPQSRLGKCKHEVYTPGRKLKQRRRRGTENGLFCARAGDWQRVRQLLNAAQMWPSPKAQRRTCRCAHSNGAEPPYPRLSNEQSKAAPRLRYLLFFVWPAQGRVPGPRRRPRDGAHGTKRGVSFRSSVASREMRWTGLVARRRPAASTWRHHDQCARGLRLRALQQNVWRAGRREACRPARLSRRGRSDGPASWLGAARLRPPGGTTTSVRGAAAGACPRGAWLCAHRFACACGVPETGALRNGAPATVDHFQRGWAHRNVCSVSTLFMVFIRRLEGIRRWWGLHTLDLSTR